MKLFFQRQGERELLEGLRSGQFSLKKTTFSFREVDRTIKDVPRLLEDVETEINQDVKNFGDLDRQIFQLHLSMAQLLDQHETVSASRAVELVERYRFQDTVQQLVKGLLDEEAKFMGIMNYLQTHRQIDQNAACEIQEALHGILRTIKVNLAAADEHRLPELTNVQAGTSLSQLIMERDQQVLKEVPLDELNGEWINKLAAKLNNMLTRVKRVHFKSMGALLLFQETLLKQGQRFISSATVPASAATTIAPSANADDSPPG